jgi:hypothetical protein
MSNTSFGNFTNPFVAPGTVSWGDISGSISSQTDLFSTFLAIGGTLQLTARSISANANILTTDYYIGCNSSSGPITLTLPSIATVPSGQEFVVKDEGGQSGVNNITVDGNGSLVDGNSTFVLKAPFEGIRCISRGSFWAII